MSRNGHVDERNGHSRPPKSLGGAGADPGVYYANGAGLVTTRKRRVGHNEKTTTAIRMNEETLITMSSAVNGPSASGMVLAPLRLRAERRHCCRRFTSNIVAQLKKPASGDSFQ